MGYRKRLERLIADAQLRHRMGQAALSEAQQRSWYEAMECLVRGYAEVIENAQTLVAA